MATETNYTGKQAFTVEHTPTYALITVEIDFDHINYTEDRQYTMMETLEEMVNFFIGAEARLQHFDLDYVKAFLQQLAQHAFYHIDFSFKKLVNGFTEAEGYWPLDGSCGITITAFEPIELDEYDDYNIQPLKF